MILTVDQAREVISTGLSDDALRLLLDAAEQAIDAVAGRLVNNNDQPITERHRPNGRMIMLGTRAASIDSVTEGSVTLEDDDYSLRTSGNVVDRLDTGTNPATRWHGLVEIVYTPYTTAAERARVQLELVKLDLAFSPGISSQSIGPWSESYGSGRPYADQRSDILASLTGTAVGIW